MLQKTLIIINTQLNFRGQYGPAQKLCRVSLWLYVFKFFFHFFQPFHPCTTTEQHSHASLGPDQPPTIFSQTPARFAEHAARLSVPWVTTLPVTTPVPSPSKQSPALPAAAALHTPPGHHEQPKCPRRDRRRVPLQAGGNRRAEVATRALSRGTGSSCPPTAALGCPARPALLTGVVL